MVASVSQYLVSLLHPLDTFRNLSGLRPVLREDGSPHCSVGNTAIVFKVEYEGRTASLRCYLRPKSNLRAIYGDRLYEDELLIFDDEGVGERVAVVLDEWYEGVTLDRAVERHCRDSEYMARLSVAFERMALELLDKEWAHGDIKPDNIIVSEDMSLHLIDFDAQVSPSVDLTLYDEDGTRAFAHPLRNAVPMAKSIDDYPLALLATALAALAYDGTLYERYGECDGLLFDAPSIVEWCSPSLDEVTRLFTARADGRHFSMAQLLRSAEPSLPKLRKLLRG